MTNLEIIQTTYEGKTSEENAKNLAKHLDKDVAWTEAKGSVYICLTTVVFSQTVVVRHAIEHSNN